MAETELLTKFEYAHISLLPEFDGSQSCSLDYFLARCDSFLSNFRRAATAPNANLINEFLFNVVKSKLKGDARCILDIEANVSYDRFKEKLIRKYGDVKNERLLLQEISNCFQRRSEPYIEYHERITSLVLRYKNLCKLNYRDQILGLKLDEIDELSLNTFKAGIFEPYRTYLRYAQITDLNQALRICRSYDNDRAYEGYMDQLREAHRQPQKPVPPRNFPNPYNGGFNHNSPSFFPYYGPQTPRVPQHLPINTQPSNQFRLGPPNVNYGNAQPSVQRNFQPPRPPVQVNRPYPTPSNIGRRFTPHEPNNRNFPRPMSGVSTIRKNVNFHTEQTEDPSYELYETEPTHETIYETEQSHETDMYFDPSLFQAEEFEVQNENNQDFHLAQSSKSKT